MICPTVHVTCRTRDVMSELKIDLSGYVRIAETVRPDWNGLKSVCRLKEATQKECQGTLQLLCKVVRHVETNLVPILVNIITLHGLFGKYLRCDHFLRPFITIRVGTGSRASRAYVPENPATRCDGTCPCGSDYLISAVATKPGPTAQGEMLSLRHTD